jgi:flagellar FliL protein
VSATAATDTSAPKPKGKKMIVFGGLGLLLVAILAAAWMLLGRGQDDVEEGDAPAAKAVHAPKPGTPPVFLPMESMVVNLADPGGDRFAQLGLTIEVMDQKTSDQVKAYLPSIRSAVLMLLSQRTSEELLTREGKEKLASEIHREVSRPLGYEVEVDEPAEAGVKPRKKPRLTPYNPVHGVLFSSFIIQ